jgi:hypothetical protein
MSINPSAGDAGVYIPDNLIAGDYPLQDRTVTITGGDYPRGAVLGVVEASGAYTLSAAAAEDGSEVPNAILARDTDASDGPVEAPVYIAGAFSARALTLGAGHTAESVREPLRALNIYVRGTVA